MDHQDFVPVVLNNDKNKNKIPENSRPKPNNRSLENKISDEDYKFPTISPGLSKQIQLARQNKKWTQKQLATACSLSDTIIKDYEASRGQPNAKYINLMGRALGVKLKNSE